MKPLMLLLTILMYSCAGIARGQDASPQETLARQLESAYEITISYIPYRIVHANLSARDIEDRWDRSTTVRCGPDCGASVAALISLVRASRQIDSDCPEDFRFIISLRNSRGELVAHAFGHSSWYCVKTDAGAFLLPSSMLEFLEVDWPPRLRDGRP